MICRRKRLLPCFKFVFHLVPFAFLLFLVWGFASQEQSLLTQADVHKEIANKFSSLKRKQSDGDFNASLSADVIDRQIAQELLLQVTREKMKAKNKSKHIDDKTRSWFSRSNPPRSSKPLTDHPLFPGFVIENPHVCGSAPVDILFYIHSAVEHFSQRRTIRDTWAGIKLFHDISVRTVFILGLPATEAEQTEVLNEFAAHGDIVQAQFSDTFRNLTYKAITALVWVNWYCPQAKYLLKVDDDYFVDTFGVVEDLLPKTNGLQNTLLCRVAKKFQIIRHTTSKWNIEPHLLPNRTHWPQFCSGFFTVITGDIIPALYESSFRVTEFVSVDDAYLFGLLTEGYLNVSFMDIRDKISVNTRPKPEEEIDKNTKFEFFVFEVQQQETTQALWDLRLKRLSEWGRAHSLYVKLFETPGKRGEVKTLYI